MPSMTALPDYRALFESLPQNVLALAPDAPRFTILGATDAYVAVSLVPRDQLLRRPLFEVFPDANPANAAPVGVASLRASLDTVLGTRALHCMDVVRYDVRRPDGSWVVKYWSPCNSPVLGADGEVRYILHQVEDVTGRMLQEEAVSDAERHAAELRAVLASIADAFYLLDRDWRFTYVNDAAEPLLQTTRDALLGRTLWEMFPGVIGSPFEEPYREAMATGRVTSAEAYFPPLGTWFDVRTYPWSGGLMVHFRDIGERKHAEEERERLLELAETARRDAEAANRGKSEFLAVMSHELRTPLNAIGGYAELMELGIRGPITAEQRADLARIQQSQRHLLGLINGVLNYARVEAGALHYAVSDVTIEETIATCEALVMPQVRAQGLTLHREPCDHSVRVRADAEKLQQVLLNLLSNAVKFTEPGGRVSVRCVAASDSVRIEVIDTGIGIAPDQLARVFEPFVQVDAKLTRTREGTGLGLAISRDLARGMGGDITAVSEPGRGSTFSVTLPRAPAEARG